MEYSKTAVQLLKTAIKLKVAEQKSVKPQRKTVHFQGERTLPAWSATQKHQSNRWDLRHMYLAYGIMRGKTIEQIEPTAKTQRSEHSIQRITEQYLNFAAIQNEQAVRSNS